MPTPRTTGAAPTGAARRARVRWRVLVPVMTAAAGLMFAMSFRAAGGSDLRADRDLPALILERDHAVASKVARLDVVQREVESLSRTSAPTDARLQALTRTADRWSKPAELAPVSGPSITVSLNDSAIPVDSLPAGFTVDDIVVHQQDVQAVVNALWAGGAKAMMLQDQRVISTSAVRCVGNTLILQGRVYSPPYVISAIGDVRTMQVRLDADPAVTVYRQYVDMVGLGYEIATSERADFPAYAGSVDLRYATAIQAGTDESGETK